ncbi:MAG TPA: 4Fe-4S dicluster domain-containing protein [Myxococcales bacterium]
MSEQGRKFSRRSLLKGAGALGALAGCSPKPGAEKLVPYLVPPEDIVPGLPLFFRTVCRECPAGCGATARTREGRAIKLEGNPEDPIGRGALCARGQATLQALYSPDRLKGPMRRGPDGKLAPVGWDEAVGQLAGALAQAREKAPSSIRLLTRPEPGLTGSVQRALLEGLGAAGGRVVLEPFDLAPVRAAAEALFGRRELPVHDLARARSVVSFGADFLETWSSPVELARGFAQGRGKIGAERTRLTWVGPRLSLTGASADAWVRTRAGGELALALGLLRWLADPASHVAGLSEEVRALWPVLARLDAASLARRADVPASWFQRLGAELAQRRPSALLGPGPLAQGPDATQLAAVVALLNYALGNVGSTVLFGLDPLEDPPSSFAQVQQLVEDLKAGKVAVLLLHHADPLGTLPRSLGAEAALAKVPLVVSFSDLPTATDAHARLLLPDHHPLESFEALVPRRGVLQLGQPVMQPLADTRAAAKTLMDVAAKLPAPAIKLPATDPWDLFQARLAEKVPAEDAQREALQRGGLYSAAGPEPVALRPGAAEPLLALAEQPAPASTPASAGELDLVFFPSALRGDGHRADLPWLKEIPDVLSSLSWIGWVELSPIAAERLGARPGEVLRVATPAGQVELAATVNPGLRDDAAAVPLGGPEALALLPAATDPGSGALAFRSARASLSRTGRRIALPVLAGSAYQHGRQIVRGVSPQSPKLERPDLTAVMYEPPAHPKHRWAMAIDLDRCTGCQACVVACYAENNVPVMGEEAAVRGRNMGWLRLERFLEERRGEVRVDLMPMLCQQCTSAPCEPVCPVYATYHTAEGLNAQVYNRCVGTRYCSNNCPYKVRTFNWRDAQFARPLDQQLNPDVTVRSKGVMEKCTFCVQRIRYGENRARDEGRPVADGEIVPACAQTCPSAAIVFGDANDPRSRVRALSSSGRAFAALEELNTGPAVTYLARVREEQP